MPFTLFARHVMKAVIVYDSVQHLFFEKKRSYCNSRLTISALC
jgi:hypothetical protein